MQKKYARNMQKYAQNMQVYAGQFVPLKYAKICKLYAIYMQKHAKYAEICTPHFADGIIICSSFSLAVPLRPGPS